MRIPLRTDVLYDARREEGNSRSLLLNDWLVPACLLIYFEGFHHGAQLGDTLVNIEHRNNYFGTATDPRLGYTRHVSDCLSCSAIFWYTLQPRSSYSIVLL